MYDRLIQFQKTVTPHIKLKKASIEIRNTGSGLLERHNHSIICKERIHKVIYLQSC